MRSHVGTVRVTAAQVIGVWGPRCRLVERAHHAAGQVAPVWRCRWAAGAVYGPELREAESARRIRHADSALGVTRSAWPRCCIPQQIRRGIR